MRSKPCLTLDDVFKMVEACRKAGAKVNEEPTIAIVDAGGALMYLERAPPLCGGGRARPWKRGLRNGRDF
jgi:uncharacterized protein GlcG (DUF336 family)